MAMTTGEATTMTAAIVLGTLQAWNTWNQRKTARTVDQVHVLVNSQMTITKKALAEVTSAKAAITLDLMDISAAQKAMEDYLEHVARQTNSDSI